MKPNFKEFVNKLKLEETSLCPHCVSFTNTIKGICGKCKNNKEGNDRC